MAAFLQECKEKQYKAYVTDALKAIVENTARFGGGVVINERWYDIQNRKRVADNRTADQIAADIVKRAGLTLAEGGEQS